MTPTTSQFLIAVRIFDAKTQIALADKAYTITSRCSERAKDRAIDLAKHEVLDIARKRWCTQYGITAPQFAAMLADNAIVPLKDYVFKIAGQKPL